LSGELRRFSISSKTIYPVLRSITVIHDGSKFRLEHEEYYAHHMGVGRAAGIDFSVLCRSIRRLCNAADADTAEIADVSDAEIKVYESRGSYQTLIRARSLADIRLDRKVGWVFDQNRGVRTWSKVARDVHRQAVSSMEKKKILDG
jgi:hypothetical protein